MQCMTVRVRACEAAPYPKAVYTNEKPSDRTLIRDCDVVCCFTALYTHGHGPDTPPLREVTLAVSAASRR
eukprot:4436891-Prymnesium_polylepis.1